MIDFNEIKEKILNDEDFANATEYLLSKALLSQKLPQLKFFYKKHKIVLGQNGLFTVYQPDGLKLASKIHYQETAKYIILNREKFGNIQSIQRIESELFRYKDKIEFFLKYNQKVQSEIIEGKIQSMMDYYHLYKNSLIERLRDYNLCE
jgi:hypothetical protein